MWIWNWGENLVFKRKGKEIWDVRGRREVDRKFDRVKEKRDF